MRPLFMILIPLCLMFSFCLTIYQNSVRLWTPVPCTVL